MNSLIPTLYELLLARFGPQGWWPLLELDGLNPTNSGSINGYHPGDYSYPKNKSQQFQIMVGAILTQNTSWTQVEKALILLQNHDILNPSKLDEDRELTKQCIKVCGYFNQKSSYLQSICKMVDELNSSAALWIAPTRTQLLRLKGVGPETADSILCYAFSQKHFVIDAYARRIFTALGWIPEKISYEKFKTLIESSLADDLICYQEFHALLVELAKRLKSTSAPEHDLINELKSSPTNRF